MASGEIEEVAGSGFRQFDVVTDYSDHYFANANKTNSKAAASAAACFANARSSLYKKIMYDWKILGESLPETIYVRAYEARIDLLRAVIIGARGTPYHDGLFFFDIAFPEDYPNSPPKVHYRSFGLRVNPNLYNSGKVCLSLLNTWTGSKCEKWNPDCSSILQILVSIQALVLNAKPYYNEPGFKPSPNYKVYNEKVFALSCKTMHLTLRVPPRNFKQFVAVHFSQHGVNILNAIVAYKNGFALVGYFYQSGGKQKPSKVAKSFVKDLDELYKMLFEDFSKIKAPGLDKLRPPLTESASNDKKNLNGASGDNQKNHANSKSDGNKKSILGYLCSKVKKIFRIVHKKSSSLKMS